MSNRLWEIAVYNSLEQVWLTRIPLHRLTESGVQRMLQTLAAKFLTYEEISGAMINRLKGGPLPNEMLQVSKSTDFERKIVTYSCGVNPYVTARTVSGDENVH